MEKIVRNIPVVFLFFISSFLYGQADRYGPEQKITVAQNFPSAVRPGSDFMVEIKIAKGNVTGLAKFQQFIPAGMTASPISNGGAEFSFEAQNVKFIWTSVPPDNLTLKYKISVSASLLGKKYLSGTFSYVENDRTKKNSLVPKEIEITPSAPATEVTAVAETKPSEEEVERQKAEASSAATGIPPDAPEPEETKSGTAAGTASSAQTTPEVTELKKQAEETPLAKSEPTAPATTAANTSSSSASPVNETAPAASGITFKVQIAAMNEKHFRRKNYFQEKFGLQMEVAAEEHEGLKKYTVGNFNSYPQAAKLRDEIRSSAEGSFVVAYKDGVRIPVSEAMEMQRKK